MSEAEEFLRTFHREHPGATARAFAHGRLSDGRNSYQWLADLSEPGQTVLDLACGDGLLSQLIHERGATPVGVDLSPDDVALARRRLPARTFHVARAQALPLADASVDAVLSHMALMLMDDIEEVVGEIARVLRPGGLLSAVVGAGLRRRDGWGTFVDLWRARYADERGAHPHLGDDRTRSHEGWTELLADGFTPVETEERTLDLSGPRDDVWTVLTLSYCATMVSPEGLAAVERDWKAQMPEHVECGLIFRRIEARRRSWFNTGNSVG